MKPWSVGRFPGGLFLILVIFGSLTGAFAQADSGGAVREDSSCQAACGSRSVLAASEQIEYLGVYSGDGKFKTTMRAERNHLDRWAPFIDSSRAWSQPSEIPAFINLHSRERVEENYEPPAHATKPVKGQSTLAAIRDNIVAFVYGRERIFLAPHHVTVDSRGRILVVDPDAHSIHVLDNNGSFRIAGGPQRRMLAPNGIAVDAADNIYVADSERGMILVYDPDGKFLRYIGKRGDETLFHHPTALAIDHASGHIFLLDSPRHLLFVLDLEGSVLKRIGRRSAQAIGRFSGDTIAMDLDYPTEIAIGNNEVVVVDSNNSRIQVMDLECRPLTQFGIPTVPGPTLVDQVGLSVDPAGRIYVSDTRDSHIRIYGRDGSLLGSFGRTGMNMGEFNSPAGLWIDGSNRLYVADTNNGRVQVFQLTLETENAIPGEGTK